MPRLDVTIKTRDGIYPALVITPADRAGRQWACGLYRRRHGPPRCCLDLRVIANRVTPGPTLAINTLQAFENGPKF